MDEPALQRPGQTSRDAAVDAATALLRVERDYLRARLDEFTAADGIVAQLTEDIARQDAQLDALQAEQARLAASLVESESRRADLVASLAEMGSQAETLRRQLSEELRQGLVARTELLRELDAARNAAGNAADEAAALRRMRNALVTSVSWRVTAPLRATTAHLPAGVRRSLRRMAKLSFWLATPQRIPRRLALLRARQLEVDVSPAALGGLDTPAALPIAEVCGPSSAVRDAGIEAAPPEQSPTFPAAPWLYVGDINAQLEQERSDEPGRAARAMAELFLASLGGIQPLLPCLLDAETPGKAGKLARVSSLDAALYLSSRLGDRRLAELVATVRFPAPLSVERSAPCAGDHLVFPALVWDPAHAALLRKLADESVRVSILLHDLTPFERRETVSPGERAAFLDWLRVALSVASLAFVPNETVRDGLLKLVILSRWQVAGDIVVGSWGQAGNEIMLCERSAEDPSSQPLARRIFGEAAAAGDAEAAFIRARRWCSETDPEVSIILVNRHAAPRIVECVRAIWANTEGPRYEILIADNDSGTGDLALLHCLGGGVRILDLGCDRYVGEASNIAAEQARGRYLCLLDGNVIVQSGWLRALHDALAAEPEAGVAGPCFLNPNGSIREAGSMIDAFGYRVPLGRGQAADAAAFQEPRDVDYVSAATLLMSRALYLRAGGCDLAYEPGCYEDADLCFKSLALGRRTLYCPAARVILTETAALSNEAEARQMALGDLNRAKFLSRWGAYLASRPAYNLQRIVETIIQRGTVLRPGPAASDTRMKAAFYTPYVLTPGGGERYLLSFAAALSADAAVTIVTPHPYSHLRLDTLAREFGLDLSQCRLETRDEFLRKPAPRFMLTMGNHILPPFDARAPNAIYLCQFPFTLQPDNVAGQGSLEGYRSIIAYSDYAKAHIAAALSANRLPQRPVTVLYPPVLFMGVPGDDPSGDRGPPKKRNMILSVGRFFVGGHSKRQDLLIDAFRAVVEVLPEEAESPELHLAGSSMPTAEDIEFLALLRRRASGLSVFFHVNVAPADLARLYQEAEIYWHGTGLGADLAREPEKAEHFGISLVEAMSAGCVVFAYGSGGPREIITDGVDGFLYGSTDGLARTTHRLLTEGEFQRQAIGRAAIRKAADFSIDRFNAEARELGSWRG